MSSCSALFLLQETNMGAVTHFKPSIRTLLLLHLLKHDHFFISLFSIVSIFYTFYSFHFLNPVPRFLDHFYFFYSKRRKTMEIWMNEKYLIRVSPAHAPLVFSFSIFSSIAHISATFSTKYNQFLFSFWWEPSVWNIK